MLWRMEEKLAYEAPTASVIGDLHELTLAKQQNKDFTSPSDGILFQGQPLLGSI